MYDKKILIIDDSKSMCSILEETLKSAGYTSVSSIYSGQDAVATISKEKPDLILLDIIMPQMNGLEVLREIGTMTKVIVLSAVGQDAIVGEATGLGAVGYIVKPVDNDELLAKVGAELAG